MISKEYIEYITVYHSILWYQLLYILQTFEEHTATLPYRTLSSPLKSSPPSSRTTLINALCQRMTSVLKHQTHRARKRLSTSFWMA